MTVVDDDRTVRGGLNFTLPDDVLALQAEATAVAQSAAATRAIQEDSWVAGYSREFARVLGDRGWLGMTWPVAEGGGGRTALERFVVTEALITEGAPIASAWIGDRQIGPTLLASGTAEQRRRFLPGIISGRESWCIGLSEPDAGSDLASVRTRATPVGDGWVIDGAKLWTSFASRADWCYVVARTDPDAPAHLGLSEFIVALSSPGIEVRDVRDMTGAVDFCEVTFDGVVVPGDQLVGQPHQCWQQLMRQLEHERGGIDRLVSNRALFRRARANANTADPRIRQRIADLEGRFTLARLLVLRHVVGQAPAGAAAVTKLLCTELEQDVADFAAAVDGPNAMLAGRTSRNVCYAPAYSIQGGTSNILRNVIAERVLGLPR